jgi:hypothetical protein
MPIRSEIMIHYFSYSLKIVVVAVVVFVVVFVVLHLSEHCAMEGIKS